MPATLTVNVVSADQEVWSGEVTLVVAKTVEGEIGLMAGHEPVLAILAAGEVRLHVQGGRTLIAKAEDGFLSCANNTVTIVAGQAELTAA